MDTVYRIAAAAGRFLRSRLFSASVLAVVTAVMVVVVSVNTRAVTVVDGDTSRVVLTMEDDPYYVLKTAGVTLGKDDVMETVVESPRAASISVSRAFNVQVTADGITTVVPMTEGTVADALEKAGVTVGEYDTLSLEPTAEVQDGTAITVERVEYREYTKTESIPYTTTTKYTNVLAKGKTTVHRQGQNGVKTLTYREQIVDGQVVDTVLVDETVTKQPVEKVILKGTVVGTPMSEAPFDIELDEAGQPVNYKSVLSGKATAYTSDRGDSGTVCSTGMKAQVGVVAVNPDRIPYGSKLYIVSPDGSYVYGYAIAGDTGGGVRSNKTVADLFMDTYEECIQFGRRTMNVYILE